MITQTVAPLILVAAGLVNSACAQGYIQDFVWTPQQQIPDGNPVGWLGQFSVSGVSGQIASFKVLLDISGGYNGDLYAYLSGPQGQFSVLVNRPGVTAGNPFGYADAGLNITLDSAAADNIHNYGSSYSLNGNGQVTGTWAADGRNIDPESDGAAFDQATATAGLSLFNGANGAAVDGTWSLFIADCAAGGGIATLNSLALEVTTVPEPQSGVLLLGMGLCALWYRRKQGLSH